MATIMILAAFRFIVESLSRTLKWKRWHSRQYFLAALTAACLCLQGHFAIGQAYPTKPIRLVCDGFGGGVDFTARLIGELLTASMGQRVVVDNRAGNVSMLTVAKAPPDGYTLLAAGAGFFMEPLFQKVSYDPVQDFLPITLAVSPPAIMVVNQSVPANSVKDLIALAKAKPGQLNYASAGVGGASFLAGELFKAMAGVDIANILYKGQAPALTDLLGGRIQIMFMPPSVALPHVNAGKVKALAVTSAQPTPLAPGIPTIAETLAGYQSVAVVGIYAPAKTPSSIVDRLNQDIVRGLNDPQVKDRLLKSGVEVVGSSPQGLAATIQSEISKWSKLVKELGLRSE